MSRLIEIQLTESCPATLTIHVGDVLTCFASGCHAHTDQQVVEVLGPFLPSVLSEMGEIMTPEGAPNTVLICARQPGLAMLDLFAGDPWHAPKKHTLKIIVGLK